MQPDNAKISKTQSWQTKMKKNVLLVEDDPALRMVVREVLKADFNIDEADNGEDGIDKGINALACPDCNAHKGPNLTSIDPETGALPRSSTLGKTFGQSTSPSKVR